MWVLQKGLPEACLRDMPGKPSQKRLHLGLELMEGCRLLGDGGREGGRGGSMHEALMGETACGGAGWVQALGEGCGRSSEWL